MEILKQISGLSSISGEVNKRLNEFKELGKKGNKEWFSELCFCILTANSKAETALRIQAELKDIFSTACSNDIKNCIIKNKHRFHNNKTRFIIEAREHADIKEKIKNAAEPREWLVENINGIGYKEASHFLRNVGYETYAILDRHILNLMKDSRLIKEIPKLNKKTYLEIEKIFLKLAESAGMNAAELDLYMWYMRTGKVLK